MEQQVILYPAELSADVCGVQVTGNSPTELYVNVIEAILKRYPGIIGSKETHFTCDSSRAKQYTGTTRGVIINGNTVYIKTGFSTKDKWKGIEKTCQLVGVGFAVKGDSAPDGVNPSSTVHSAVESSEEKRYPVPTEKQIAKALEETFRRLGLDPAHAPKVDTDILAKTMQSQGKESETPKDAKCIQNSEISTEDKSDSFKAEDTLKNRHIENYITYLNLLLEDIVFSSNSAIEFISCLTKAEFNMIEFPYSQKYCEENPIYAIIGKYDGYKEQFPNSKHAKFHLTSWRLYRGITAFVGCSGFSLNTDTKCNAELIIRTLEMFAREGFASASYYLGTWYGSGITGYSITEIQDPIETWSAKYAYAPYILKPDKKKMVSYYEEAAHKGYVNAFYALGVYHLYCNNIDTAYRYFNEAKEKGHANAQIMLRYLNQPNNQVTYNHCIEHFNGNRRCDGRPQEYKGYLYYFKWDVKLEHNDKILPCVICKKRISNPDAEEIVIRTFPRLEGYHNEFPSHRHHDSISGYLFPLGFEVDYCYFSVANDQIYFHAYDKVYSMDLDGKNVCEVPLPTRKWACGYLAPYATKYGIVLYSTYERNKLAFYSYHTKSIEEIASASVSIKIIGVSDKEIYYDKSEKTISICVYNISTGMTQNLKDVYPALKKHIPVLIDCKREIVYYAESDVEDSRPLNFTKNLFKSKIIGINKAGEVVDVWEKPRIFPDFLNSRGYDCASFSGKNLACIISNSGHASARENLNMTKLTEANDITFTNTILSFDRLGIPHCIYHDENDDLCSSMQILTENFMTTHVDRVHHVTAIPLNYDASQGNYTLHLATSNSRG